MFDGAMPYIRTTLALNDYIEEHVCEVVSDLSPDVELDVLIDCLFAKCDMLYV